MFAPQAAPMPDNILAFPGVEIPTAQPSPRDRMSFAEVARDLAIDGYRRDAQIIEKLRSLHRHSGMPLPENPRFIKGVPCKGADNICARSIWSRRKFMAWKYPGDFVPPASPAEARMVHLRLCHNAARLAGQAL